MFFKVQHIIVNLPGFEHISFSPVRIVKKEMIMNSILIQKNNTFLK